ncbi:undecaprenyl-phosphate alpha-N-acetylglucosaminyl 1-phosphate transferase [Secundilactobacillus paracollinoides]|uniref:Undecaprenyl-phosphate alpha-N-acetylglucosaminyl 1-phosphate transferase n=1 Tax=Secundilactobacillus paracollinoides TaxID=240427 RepID=A0A1B2IZK4_9LACO|nr:MraY family glycosyltransferase [Secundilactobacillus paracollinoides]ANZ61572.1 undecaprenyl-phosphate alpha-N-acetylglucosaminyl 1-phosphate transferase [Secundilactobacillus paracollinoides]ANZ63213.1 undecaprenyl-phosphate alpha-N-acetylglucosaminyl 1-phosphate transferase [Secundilactobacillus paracollinoides]ANZ67491.1 undecaprenyl-phosphate alpha-N-acetylglucosaminyl 1-phosphate transferase [Secundilactobacillus paracollinoides]
MKFEIIVSLIATMIFAAILTPFIRKLAFRVGAVDNPNARRVNKVPMPTMGGLAIFLAYTFATVFLLRQQISTKQLWGVFGGECIIILTGIIDDIFELKPRQKVLGISLAALEVYFVAGVKMIHITLPFIGSISLGWLSLPVTWIWILAITNAVNLIDGLDGLADGVGIIALSTMGITGFFFLNVANTFVSISIFALVFAMVGFLPYNFFPARIYLGDTGSLFIGFMISVFSLYGLKNVTFISVIIPVIILGVPITDTVYAILRRMLNRQPISHADKHHLHHRLMQLGLTHRQTVMVIYGIALIFAFISLLYPISPLWGAIFLTIASLVGLELFVEAIGLVGKNRQPLLNWINKMVKNTTSKNSH